jgi:hypothetical protein
VLRQFSDDVGIPDQLRADLATELTGRNTEFQRQTRLLKIRLSFSEKGRSNQNFAAEREIGELKKRWRRKMTDKCVPKRLWDYGLVHQAEILSRISRGKSGRTGIEEITGETPEISEWLDFDFYDLVWWLDQKKPGITDENRRLGRWLGISHRVGSDMCYWILTESGKVVARTSVQHVTRDELLDDALKVVVTAFDLAVNTRLDDANFVNLDAGDFYLDDEYDDSGVAHGDGTNTPTDAEYGDMLTEDRPEQDDIDNDAYDKYIGAEVMMDVPGEGPKRATVKRRAENLDGPIGNYHRNPMMDTREYELEYDDGTADRYFANVIAENLYSQVDSEGHQFLVIQEITEHHRDSTAIDVADGFTISKNGNKVPKKTTRGWKFLTSMKEGFSQWLSLVDLKESNPIELAEYAVANKIDHEPAFVWWVPFALRKRNRVISKLQKKYWRTTHKFGLECPNTVKRALEIDEETGTDFWYQAIKLEMEKVKVAYEVNEEWTPEQIRSGEAPGFIGFQEIRCHLIMDIKMDFSRKARFVAGGHMTEAPAALTYSSVVSRDSVRLAFLIAELNDLDVLACDVGNAYLNAPCREKIWFVAGRECGEHVGKVMVVTRALYGLKSSGASWRAMFAETLTSMGFEPTQADPDAYRRRARKPDGTDYYELLLVYVDDVLACSHDPQAIMDVLQKTYILKKGSLGPPTIYLGAEISKYQLGDGKSRWSMSSTRYVKNAIKTVEELLEKDGRTLRKCNKAGKQPLPNGYRPELEATDELNEELSSRYLQLIGILRWAVELGRIDIYTEVAIMSQYSASPRLGHLEGLYHIFAYLAKKDKSRIVFDPTRPKIDESAFAQDADWKDFYGDVTEELPPRMPEPLGKSVHTTCFVDANHAGNVVTRRSHSGILIYVMNTPIIWFSKKQNTVEASTFGSEFVAMRIAKDLIVALRYKLRMFGVPIDGPTDVMCDNQGVVKNASLPQSTLGKKHNAINYHSVREAAAASIIRVGKEDTETNLADLLTKILHWERRHKLLGSILYST